MANTRNSYEVFDFRPKYHDRIGIYGSLPFSPLGTAAAAVILEKKPFLMKNLSAYVAGDGVSLPFSPSSTAVSEYVFRNFLGNTGGTSSPNSGNLLVGYGLIDISQSNEYLDLVGSLSRGTGTGTNYNTAVTYVNGVLSRLNTDFPNMNWSVKGIPFNHYFLITSPLTGMQSPFGTGNYFHPQHPTGSVRHVYDWINAPSVVSEFYRNRAKAPLEDIVGMKWICPSGSLYFDNDLPFFKRTFDPDTMYQANRECFDVAKQYVESSGRELKIMPFYSPVYKTRLNRCYDPNGGLTSGATSNATPTQVSREMFLYNFVQPMKDVGVDGAVMWNNLTSLVANTKGNTGQISNRSAEQITLARNYFSNRLFSGATSVNWASSTIRENLISDAAVPINNSFGDVSYSIQLKAGQSCCPTDPYDCATCKCKAIEGPHLPWCFERPEFFEQASPCCSLSEYCAYKRVDCSNVICDSDSSVTYCRWSGGNTFRTLPVGGGSGSDGCPPGFEEGPPCGFPCAGSNVDCGDPANADICLCCCHVKLFVYEQTNPNEESSWPNLRFADETYGSSPFAVNESENWRSTYMLPSGGAYGYQSLDKNKRHYFLVPSIVSGLDPLVTGQYGELNTTAGLT